MLSPTGALRRLFIGVPAISIKKPAFFAWKGTTFVMTRPSAAWRHVHEKGRLQHLFERGGVDPAPLEEHPGLPAALLGAEQQERGLNRGRDAHYWAPPAQIRA